MTYRLIDAAIRAGISPKGRRAWSGEDWTREHSSSGLLRLCDFRKRVGRPIEGHCE